MFKKLLAKLLLGNKKEELIDAPKDDFEIAEILRQHVGMLAEKSKDCELKDLRENSQMIINILETIKNYM